MKNELGGAQQSYLETIKCFFSKYSFLNSEVSLLIVSNILDFIFDATRSAKHLSNRNVGGRRGRGKNRRTELALISNESSR